ncbi:MAG: SprB repeat-containing protein, partial [Nitrospinaceae bacterium]|nr:SprB repeat-containing protein [Nitrospinaceae bacterium]
MTSLFDAYGNVTTNAGTYATVRQLYTEQIIDSIFAYCSDPAGCNAFIVTLPFGWSFVPSILTQFIFGGDNPELDTTYTYKWWANGEDVPVVEIETNIPAGVVVSAKYKLGNNVIAMADGSTDALCNNTCDGTASVMGLGGTGTYMYVWDDPMTQTTATATGLCAGTYNAFIVDGVDTSGFVSITVGEPTQLNVIITTTDDDGTSNGTAMSLVSGGTSPYLYSWNTAPLQSTANAVNLAGGTYILTVTDANGCIYVDTAEVNLVPGCNVSSSFISSANIICAGGTINFTNTSTGGLTYDWSENGIVFATSTNAIRTFNTAGSYVIQLLVDSFGCSDFSQITITVNALPTATITPSGATTFCLGGSVALVGSSAVSYLWSNSAITQSISVSASGTHSVVVTDINGCTATSSSVTVIVNALPSILSVTSTDASSCGTSDGTINISANGGTAPLQYSINGGTSFVSSSSFSSLAAGNYDIAITDANGCVVMGNTETVSAPGAPTATAGSDATICAGSTYSLSGTIGGTALTASWSSSGSGNFDNASLLMATYTPSAADTVAGSVTLTITSDDPDGPGGPCQAATDAMILTINTPASANAGVDDNICEGDSYTLSNATVGGATSLTWSSSGSGSFDNVNMLGATYTPSAADITSGTVTITLLTNDPTGPCTAATDDLTLTIIQDAITSAGLDGNVCDGDSYTLMGTMGGGATSVTWSSSGTGSFADATLLAAVYSPSVADVTGGTVTLTITTDDPVGSCIAASDQMVLSINPKPAVPTISPFGSSLSCVQTATSYQWFFNGDTIQSATNQVYVASQTGVYQVAVVDNNGCWEVSANLGYTGVSNLDAGFRIDVYPNPSSGLLFFDVKGVGSDALVIRIENILGQSVYKKVLGKKGNQVGTSLDVSFLPT